MEENGFNFDLKDYRQNKLKMTQEDFAKLIDERQDYVSRIEKNPETITLVVLMKIATATGTSVDELIGFKKQLPKALEVQDTWDKIKFIKKTLVDYIKNKIPNKGIDLKDSYVNMISEFDAIVNISITKPTVAVAGMSDAGKSKLINSLLGLDKLPTSWTPTTAISIYIKHIEDKPKFVKNDVCIFRAQVNNEIGWDIKRYENEEYCNEWELESGSIEMLSKYGVRNESETDEAGAAVIYLDSQILKLCDIVDLPGFGTGDRETDDSITNKAISSADIVIYMSLANGFLRGTDIEFLKATINMLPAIENEENKLSGLSNLYIIASQAHTVEHGNIMELGNVLNIGCMRLFKQIPEEIWQNKHEVTGQNYDYNTLRKRFFTYTTDIPMLRESFELDLIAFIENYPKILEKSVRCSINERVKNNKSILATDIEQYYNIINEREKYKELMNLKKEDEPRREDENRKLRKGVISRIEELNRESNKKLTSEYDSIISVDGIVNIIDSQGYKKNKEDIELLAGFLGSKLQVRLQNILKSKSAELNKVIDEYIDNFNTNINFTGGINLNSVNIPFDAKRAFASGLAGLVTFGGLAAWASTLGNLGAYILVTKGVSLLSAIGISISGGTATVTTLVSSIGGPIVLGITLAIIASLTVYSLFGSGWKKSLSKKMIKEYEKQNVIIQLLNVSDEYWKDTIVAFNVASDNMEQAYQKSVKELENIINSYNIEEIEKYIKQAKDMNDFFEEMPL